MGSRLLAVTVLLWCCSGSALAGEESYAERLARRPLPTDEAGRRAECAWIRQEDARLQNLLVAFDMQTSSVQPGPYNFTSIYRAQLQMGVRDASAALASRASDVGCTAAFSSAPQAQPTPAAGAAVPGGAMSFDDCFQKCKQYTSRTNEQCFDSCRTAPSASGGKDARPMPPRSPSLAKARNGESCDRSGDCEGMLLCIAGQCSSRRAGVGEACRQGNECDGYVACTGGKCAAP
jgi:hypothetical protein